MPRKTVEQHHIGRLFPNMVTLLGMCAGFTAIRFALSEKWEWAVGFIVIAALIDAMDGRVARLLDATSSFGAQLDSLSDFLNFGVAPPFILYLWATHDIKAWGWALVLLFAVCAAIRLARFNTSLDDEEPDSSKKFFVGIPSPAGALLALFPMAVFFEFGDNFQQLFLIEGKDYLPLFLIIYGTLIAFGMASRMPTYSWKRLTFRQDYASIILIAAGLLFIALITVPWLTLIGVGTFYICSIPLGILFHYNALKNSEDSSQKS